MTRIHISRLARDKELYNLWSSVIVVLFACPRYRLSHRFSFHSPCTLTRAIKFNFVLISCPKAALPSFFICVVSVVRYFSHYVQIILGQLVTSSVQLWESFSYVQSPHKSLVTWIE